MILDLLTTSATEEEAVVADGFLKGNFFSPGSNS